MMYYYQSVYAATAGWIIGDIAVVMFIAVVEGREDLFFFPLFSTTTFLFLFHLLLVRSTQQRTFDTAVNIYGDLLFLVE